MTLNAAQIHPPSESGIVARVLAFDPARPKAVLLVLLAVVLFCILPIYQTLRQPRIGDDDVIRLGLLVLNRDSRDQFPGDAAFQAGDWWAGYTPSYLDLLGVGYHLTNDLGIVFAALTAVVYLVLLVGFYTFGRYWGLPFVLALLLAYTSGLYIVAAQALAWAGVGNEMATPRNLYLCLFPWMLLLASWIYRTKREHLLYWFILGIVLGASTILHSVTGAVVVSIVALMLLAGVVTRQFRWQTFVVYIVGVLPGAYIGYKSVSDILFVIVDPNVTFAAIPFIYDSIARADLFFYRIPSWTVPLILFGIATLISGALILLKKWQRQPLPNTLWIAFGLIQFAGLLLILVLDWWTFLVAVEWARRVRSGEETPLERLAMIFLAASNIMALIGSPIFSLISLTTPFDTALGIARVFQRGGTLGYTAIIVLTAYMLWGHLRRSSQPGLYFTAAVATLVIGFHQGIFETIPGSWLPFDFWTYLGIAVLLFWDALNRDWLRDVRVAVVAMLVTVAITRIMAIIPNPVPILMIGLVVFAISWLTSRFATNHVRRNAVLGAGALVTLVILLLPIGGLSIVGHVLSDTPKVLRRDWSRVDSANRYEPLYPLGTWLRANTPAGSLVMTDITELRYWSFRPQTVAALDTVFLYGNQTIYKPLYAESQRVEAAYQSPEALLQYSQQVGAAYIVVRKSTQPVRLNGDQASVAFEDDNFIVYQPLSAAKKT